MAGLFQPQYNFFGQEMTSAYDPSLTKDAQAYAALPAGRGAVASAYQASQNAANSFGNAIGGLFNMAGVQSPIQQKQRALQGIIGSINPQDPTSLQQAASQLLGMGMTTEAQQLMEEARKIQESQSKVGMQEAQTGMYGAQGQKYLAEGQKALQWEGIEKEKLAQKEVLETKKLAIEQFKARAQAANDYASVAKANAEIAKINREMETGGSPAASIQELKYYENLYNQNPTPENKALLAASREKVSGSQRAAVEAQKATVAREQMNAQFGVDAAKVTAPAYDAAQAALSLDSGIENFKAEFLGNVPEANKSRVMSTVEEFAKEWTSNQDRRTVYLQMIKELSQDQVFSRLKSLGGAQISNKDLDFAMSNIPNENSKPEFVFEWMNRMQKGAKKAQQTYELAEKRIAEKQVQPDGSIKYLTQPEVQKVIYEAKKEVLSSPSAQTNTTNTLPAGWSVKEK